MGGPLHEELHHDDPCGGGEARWSPVQGLRRDLRLGSRRERLALHQSHRVAVDLGQHTSATRSSGAASMRTGSPTSVVQLDTNLGRAFTQFERRIVECRGARRSLGSVREAITLGWDAE